MRRFRRIFALGSTAMLLPRAAAACPICFGAADSALLHGARLGVVVMAAITIGVLAAFARWFLRLRRLERAHESS
jgi:hypothetical protein